MDRSTVAALKFQSPGVAGFQLSSLESVFSPRTGIASNSGRSWRKELSERISGRAAEETRTVTMPTPDAERLTQPGDAQAAALPYAGVGDGAYAETAFGAPAAPLAPAAPAAIPQASSADQDRALVQAALYGNQMAFGELVTRYQGAVFNMCYRMLGDPTEAEDAAQEVFVRAWNQLRTFQMDRRFSTWLLSIASHYCIDMLRRRKPSAPLDDVALFVQSDDPEPEDVAIQAEQSEMVQRLLNTLPDKYRSVTVLRYYNDLSYDEIAKATGLTESAVKTQLHRARKMLADQLVGAGVVGNTAKGGAS